MPAPDLDAELAAQAAALLRARAEWLERRVERTPWDRELLDPLEALEADVRRLDEQLEADERRLQELLDRAPVARQ